jgi:hypothetical protein
MSDLERLQHGFQAYVAGGSDFAHAIVSDARAPAERRLRVYYDAYRLRLIEVLRKDFAGLAALLSDDEWQQMATGYLATHPSTSPSVRWLGRHLAGYLADAAPWSARPELAEMAAFEWYWGRSFDAPDMPCLDAAALQALAPDDWPRLRLDFHPALQLLDLRSNVAAVYQAVSSETPPPALVFEDEPACWMLWRHELRVYWRSAPADEALALSAVAADTDFAGLCAAMAAVMPDDAVPARAVQIIQQWLVDGLMVDLRTG